MGGHPDFDDLPLTESDERMHLLASHCWCDPSVEVCDNGARIIHHRPTVADALDDLTR